ncbi:MAG: hypothetical protein PVJ86_03250, partial [Phycisphaerales bacterium]
YTEKLLNDYWFLRCVCRQVEQEERGIVCIFRLCCRMQTRFLARFTAVVSVGEWGIAAVAQW